MSTIFCDSTDHYSTADELAQKWSYAAVKNHITLENTNPPYSDKKYVKMTSGQGCLIQKNIGAELMYGDDRTNGYIADAYIGFRNYTTILPSTYFTLAEFLNGGSIIAQLEVVNDGSIRLKNHAGTVVASTTADKIKVSTWQMIEFRLKTADSSGVISARVDDVEIASYTGDTKGTASGANSVIIHSTGTTGGYNCFTDFYMTDSEFYGSARIRCLYPNAAGTYSLFSPSTGVTNYACVDERYLDESDYISGTGNADSYNFQAVGLDPAEWEIKSVQIVAHVKKTNAGNCSAVLTARVNGTNYPTPDQLGGSEAHKIYSLSDSARFYTSIFNLNPDDNASWDISDIDAAEFGIWNYGA